MNGSVAPSIDERIDAGVAWLDANVPDWTDRIDLDRLALRSVCNCVLGQTFAHLDDVDPYGEAVFRFRLADDQPVGLGFDTTEDRGEPTYDDLTRSWRSRITALRSERAS